jgi:DNA polymerase I
VEALIYDVEYDADKNAYRLILFFPSYQKFFGITQPWLHKPYFLVLTDEDEEEVRRAVGAVEAEEVFLLHRPTMQTRRFVKAYVRTPLDVRHARERAKEVGTPYESDIKYLRNVMVDFDLRPWTPCEAEGRKVRCKQFPDPWAHIEEPVPVPPAISFDIEVLPESEARVPSPDNPKQPVIAVSMMADGWDKPKVFALKGWCGKGSICFESEEELLLAFAEEIRKYPLVVGYNIEGFDIPYLEARWKRLGLPEEAFPFERSKVEPGGRHPITGKEVVWHQPKHGRLFDLFVWFANPSIKAYTYKNAYDSASLESVSQALLGEGKEFGGEKSVLEMTPDELTKYSATDALLTHRLWEHSDHLVFKTAVLIARVSRLPISAVWTFTISSWIAQLMLYWHRLTNSVFPNKEELMQKTARTKSKTGKRYAGAVVFEAPKGVFKDVVVLDFASLYPSTIIRYNLSYETVNPLFPCEEKTTVPEAGHEVCMQVRGIVPQVLEALRDLRVKKYKRLAKDKSLPEEKRRFYDAVQMTIKVYINASYGVFGSENFRLFSPAVAESVTAFGRHIITQTRKRIEELGCAPLYGDTDSVFVDLRGRDEREVVEEVSKWVKERFGIDIELDKRFKLIVFSGRKKNYAGVLDSGKVVVAGMLGTKKNVPPLVRQAFSEAVNALKDVAFGKMSLEDYKRHVEEVIRRAVKAIPSAPLEELAFQFTVGRFEEYKTPTSPSARMINMLLAMGFEVLPGDVVKYIRAKKEVSVRIPFKDGRSAVPLVGFSSPHLPASEVYRYYPRGYVLTNHVPLQVARKLGVKADVKAYTDILESAFSQLLEGLGMHFPRKSVAEGGLMAFLRSSPSPRRQA